MIEITLENHDVVRFSADDPKLFRFEVNSDNDLIITLDTDRVAFYPTGQWRHVVSLNGKTVSRTGTYRGSQNVISYKFIENAPE